MTDQPNWPRRILQAAAIYNLLWGAWVIFFPNHWFDLTGIPRPNYPGIWQCVGMIVGVYGLGYWWASRNFAQHWPVIAVGFLGKIFGPIGFLQSAIQGQLPWSWGWMILTNDLIWWLPFGAMLYLAFKHNSDPSQKGTVDRQADWTLDQANDFAKTSTGQSISELSNKGDVLLVFLRHAGCTFCRETLDELRKSRSAWEQRKLTPVVVHMGSEEQGLEMMKRYDLQDCPVISDPDCKLFRAYSLPRGSWRQLFGLNVWIEGFKAAIVKGYGFGKLVGDGFQMSGSFLVRDGRIKQAYPSKDAADSCTWKPALKGMILLSCLSLGFASTNNGYAQSETRNTAADAGEHTRSEIIELSKISDGVHVQILDLNPADQELKFDVQSESGIGGFRVTRKADSWPKNLQIRLKTRGLEQIKFQLGEDAKFVQGEFSTSEKRESWTEVTQEVTAQGALKTTSKSLSFKHPLIRVRNNDGTEVNSIQIPLQEEKYFVVHFPHEWLTETNPEWIHINWIDFFRR